jgi:hypothetical protein
VLVACGVLVGLLAAEGLFRLLAPGYVPTTWRERELFCVHDAELGWRPRPDVRARHQRFGFSVEVAQNRLGLRAPDGVGLEARPGVTRCLVLGDSFVWGFGVAQDELLTAPGVHGCPGLELVNLGVSGYSTDQELLLYERLGGRFAADHVAVVVTPYNDPRHNLAAEAYGHPKPYFTAEDGRLVLHHDHLRAPVLPGIRAWVRTRSALANALDARLRARREARSPALRAEQARGPLLGPDGLAPADLAGVDLTARLLDRLRARAAAHGRTFLVVLAPSKPHALAGSPDNHPIAVLLRERLAALGVDCIDPHPSFLARSRAGDTLFNPRDRHLNAAGHALLAEVLSERYCR